MNLPPALAADTVTILRSTWRNDGHGNRVEDWSNPTTTEVGGCSVQPGASAENLTNRDAVLHEWRAWLPADADILATDHVEVPSGVVCEVVGEPQRWAGLGLDHIEVYLTRWEG